MNTLNNLIEKATSATFFNTLEDYASFCQYYFDYIQNGLQAVIVAQNEPNYQFFQYKVEGKFKVTRPINSDLFFSSKEIDKAKSVFFKALKNIQAVKDKPDIRTVINRYIYTCQQAIGATLDSVDNSNSARKICGERFENLIRLLINRIGIHVETKYTTNSVKINETDIVNYRCQHDLIVSDNKGNIKAIGSVKTSSKDRLDKIFFDKLIYNQITGTKTPHFSVFLNDVQRLGKSMRNYQINSTFVSGHFQVYTVVMCPLDGVYYCDLRPNMKENAFLSQHIHSLDYLLTEDIWKFQK